MKRYNCYQDYVIQNGEFIGEFEQMYQDFNDPWKQSERANSTEKAICTNIVKSYSFKRVIELGCGFGNLTSSLNKVSDKVLGIDISPTAINKAKRINADCNFEVGNFSDFDIVKNFKPDCIVMSEITWYVLDYIDEFKDFLKKELPETYLIHLLMTYKKGVQKYGVDKFTNLLEIKKFFEMNYQEYGEIESDEMNGNKYTYFVGRYKT